MPTRDVLDEFRSGYKKLSPEERQMFRLAVHQFVEDLKRGQGFRGSLRVKSVKRRKGVFEMTWAPNGRATFEYGDPLTPGDTHIIWRRIGGHEIFDNP